MDETDAAAEEVATDEAATDTAVNDDTEAEETAAEDCNTSDEDADESAAEDGVLEEIVSLPPMVQAERRNRKAMGKRTGIRWMNPVSIIFSWIWFFTDVSINLL